MLRPFLLTDLCYARVEASLCSVGDPKVNGGLAHVNRYFVFSVFSKDGSEMLERHDSRQNTSHVDLKCRGDVSELINVLPANLLADLPQVLLTSAFVCSLHDPLEQEVAIDWIGPLGQRSEHFV